MLNIITFVYAICGLFCIGKFVYSVACIVQGKNKLTDKISDGWFICVYVFVFLFAIYDEIDYLKTNIPDGEYKTNISVTIDENEIAYYLPADLIISTKEDYESRQYYAGAAEMTSTKVTINKDFYLSCIYLGERSDENKRVIDEEVYPEEDKKVEFERKDGGEPIYVRAKVNIGVISPQTLGITMKENWENEGFVGKAETILAIVASGFFVVQYFMSKRYQRL